MNLQTRSVEYRRLGQTDISTSIIGFGCARIACVDAPYRSKEIRATLRQAFDIGINFFDTADSYGLGESERLLGDIIHRHRQQAIICTKAGYRAGGARRFLHFLKPAASFVLRQSEHARSASAGMRRGALKQSFGAEYITARIEDSLRRLKTDYIDLFLLHSPPVAVIADRTVFDTLRTLKQKGLIRYYGVSCSQLADASLCLEHPDVSVLQIGCNLFEATALHHLFSRALEQGVGIVLREPFAQGQVFKDPRLAVLVEQNPSRTAAQAALRALMHLPAVNVVLAGMTSRSHLIENIAAVTAPPLSRDEMATLGYT